LREELNEQERRLKKEVGPDGVIVVRKGGEAVADFPD
jgi:hypothetical protein